MPPSNTGFAAKTCHAALRKEEGEKKKKKTLQIVHIELTGGNWQK